MTGSTSQGAGQPGVSRGLREYFQADEIVVGQPYVRLVQAELGPAAEILEQDDRLRLALLRLPADEVLASLREQHPEYVTEATEDALADLRAANAGRDGDLEPSSLDLTMRVLRRIFTARYAGWVPTMGKNRIVGPVTGSYVIDGGGGNRPVAVKGDYVIDGGGVGAPRSADVVVVPRRSGTSGSGVRVAIVDTRLDVHPWLDGGYTGATSDIRPRYLREPLEDIAGHATFVTGLVLRQAPGAVVDVHAGLKDNATQDSWSLARTIAGLAGTGTPIINLSLGCHTDDGQPPLVLAAALATLGPQTVVVAAAGNHGEPEHDGVAGRPAPRPMWPAAFEQVIAVGALGGEKLADFTPRVPWLDVVAPGADVASTYVPRSAEEGAGAGEPGFARWSGTSFAAAAVSGELATRLGAEEADAWQAWVNLRDEAKPESGELPVVALRPAGGWPADGTDR